MDQNAICTFWHYFDAVIFFKYIFVFFCMLTLLIAAYFTKRHSYKIHALNISNFSGT